MRASLRHRIYIPQWRRLLLFRTWLERIFLFQGLVLLSDAGNSTIPYYIINQRHNKNTISSLSPNCPHIFSAFKKFHLFSFTRRNSGTYKGHKDSPVSFVDTVSKLCISSGKTIFRPFCTLREGQFPTFENARYKLEQPFYWTRRVTPSVSRLLGPIIISKSPGSQTHWRSWL